MPIQPDKNYQSAQIQAARRIVTHMRECLTILQEAEFFVDVDTMRDVVDPQGAAACVAYLAGVEVPADLTADPNVSGLVDEIERMQAFPTAELAVRTMFRDERFRGLLQEAIVELQREFGDIAGETPQILVDYFDDRVLPS